MFGILWLALRLASGRALGVCAPDAGPRRMGSVCIFGLGEPVRVGPVWGAPDIAAAAEQTAAKRVY